MQYVIRDIRTHEIAFCNQMGTLIYFAPDVSTADTRLGRCAIWTDRAAAEHMLNFIMNDYRSFVAERSLEVYPLHLA